WLGSLPPGDFWRWQPDFNGTILWLERGQRGAAESNSGALLLADGVGEQTRKVGAHPLHRALQLPERLPRRLVSRPQRGDRARGGEARGRVAGGSGPAAAAGLPPRHGAGDRTQAAAVGVRLLPARLARARRLAQPVRGRDGRALRRRAGDRRGAGPGPRG